jgi:tetratricopeptide (TPR) repeat protein
MEEQLRALGYVATTDRAPDWDVTKDPRKLAPAANDIFQGIMLMAGGDPRAALPRFQSAYRADPENPSALFLLADCLREQGDWLTSMEYYRRAIAAAPDFATAYAHLAVLEFDHGDRDEAMRLLDEILQRDPGSFPVLMTAGELSETMNSGRAAEYYRRAAKIDQRRVEPVAKLAMLAEKRGDAAEARKLWKEALEIDANHPMIPARIRERARR